MISEQLRQTRVLVVGDVMLDRYWFGDVDRISPEAPVPVVRVQQIDERLGGAANVARNIAALGAAPVLMGVVGSDEAGSRVHELIAAAGIRDQVFDDAQAKTTVKLRVIGRQQQLLRADFESVPDHEVLLEKRDQFNAFLPEVQAVVLSDYGKGGLLHIQEMITAAKSRGVMTLVDPKGDEYSRYAGATMLTPNRSEFTQVVGRWKTEGEMTEKAHRLRQDLGLAHLLVTRSDEGMSLYTEEQGRPKEIHVAAQAREVFDVSGAGDTVIATLAVTLAAGAPVVQAIELANRAGGIVVGKLGTATVTAEELFSEGGR
ncbi:MAG: D-glycero-beta-D-manno-heptose-7-phosphate kinase [Burkholderiaceae bacterium]|nr:D-glycero-beta-D-manno-heptose-7-phosphate kinase [Burkholderiaceae bacterium]